MGFGTKGGAITFFTSFYALPVRTYTYLYDNYTGATYHTWYSLPGTLYQVRMYVPGTL